MLNGKVAIGDIMNDVRIPIDAYKPTFVRSLVMIPVRQQAPVAAIGAYWKTKHTADDGFDKLMATSRSRPAAEDEGRCTLFFSAMRS